MNTHIRLRVMNMGWSKVKTKILHKILGEYLIELQSIDMMPEIKSAWREYLQILRDILAEIKLLRVTGQG